MRTPEARERSSAAKRGICPANFETAQRLAWAANRKDVLTYVGIHAWVRRTWGTPTTCEGCGKTGLTGRKIHWASRTRVYTRERSDWLRLCRLCHFQMDRQTGSDFFGGRHLPPIQS